MHGIDLAIFLVCTLGVVVYGSSFFRRGMTADDFTAAGKNLPGWVVGMSIFSTYVSSISYLGYPGKSYAGNWNAYVFALSIPIAAWVAVRWFVPFYRRQTSISAYSFLEQRFGRWARLYASTCYLLTEVARIGTIIFLLALPMNILLGWHLPTVIVLTCLAILCYSMLGGVKGVIWTEAIQACIMIVGALVCLVLLLCRMPEGPRQVLDIALQNGKFSLGDFGADLSQSTFWVCLIYGIFINLQNYGIDQNYVQRYHTAKSTRAAKFSVLLGGWLYIPVTAVFFLIGTSLYAYYTATGIPPQMEGIKADYVFPYFIVNELPVGMTGLLIASIFAAGMSTVATAITSASTIVLTDFYQTFRREAGNKERLAVLKVAATGIALAGIGIALAMLNVESTLDAWWKLSSVFSGGMLGLFLLGIAVARSKRVNALLGVVCGVLTIGWISADEWLHLPPCRLHENLSIVCGTVVIFLVGFITTNFCTRKTRK